MKKSKYEVIKAKREEAMTNRAAIEAKIQSLAEQEKTLRTEAEAAAEAGNAEEYLLKKRKAEDIADIAYVEKKRLDKSLSPIPEAELLAAWSEYMSDQDPKIKAADAEVISAIKNLYDKFCKLEEALKAAEVIRETCVEFNGGVRGGGDWKERLAHFELTEIKCNWVSVRDILLKNGYYDMPAVWTTGMIFGSKQSHV